MFVKKIINFIPACLFSDINAPVDISYVLNDEKDITFKFKWILRLFWDDKINGLSFKDLRDCFNGNILIAYSNKDHPKDISLISMNTADNFCMHYF